MFFPKTKGYALEELAMLFNDEANVIHGVWKADIENEEVTAVTEVRYNANKKYQAAS
jgi:hypothetical protein